LCAVIGETGDLRICGIDVAFGSQGVIVCAR
jgi:hypothetical protein